MFGIPTPTVMQSAHFTFELNLALKLNPKVVFLCWLPIRHLDNIPRTTEALKLKLSGLLLYKCIQVVKEHRHNFLGMILSLFFK